jgi:ATP synthase protein I
LKIESNSHPSESRDSGGIGQRSPGGIPWRDWGDEAQDFVAPLSREQVVRMGLDRPSVSVWRVLLWQALSGVGLAALLALVDRSWAWSALYGAAAVVLPGLVFARGLTGRLSSINAGTAVAGFFVWEFVKIGLTLAMLLAAPRLVEDLNWPALLAGLVVTMKVVWLSVWVQSRRSRASGANRKNGQ